MINNYNEYLVELLIESIKNNETKLFMSLNLRDILYNIDKDYKNNISIHLLIHSTYLILSYLVFIKYEYNQSIISVLSLTFHINSFLSF